MIDIQGLIFIGYVFIYMIMAFLKVRNLIWFGWAVIGIIVAIIFQITGPWVTNY